jgi:hypothetical protein
MKDLEKELEFLKELELGLELKKKSEFEATLEHLFFPRPLSQQFDQSGSYLAYRPLR